jgi:hypothetical protein
LPCSSLLQLLQQQLRQLHQQLQQLQQQQPSSRTRSPAVRFPLAEPIDLMISAHLLCDMGMHLS